ncbi:MAG: hypothetical protein ACHP84_02965 [Caulobacterales bacterium]
MKAALFYYIPPEWEASLHPDETIKVVHRGEINYDAFARGLAKIGYCHAVAFGHLAATKPLPIARFILGLENLGSYLVGSDPTEEPTPDEGGILHHITLSWYHYPTRDILVAHVRLFANAGTDSNGMPTFLVAIAERSPQQATQAHR